MVWLPEESKYLTVSVGLHCALCVFVNFHGSVSVHSIVSFSDFLLHLILSAPLELLT